MAAVSQIDSNVSESRYSVETAFKTADPSAVWKLLEVNSYSDAAAKFSKVARTPIVSDRQRKKGVTVDLDANFGFTSDLTQYNLRDLLQGLFFANLRAGTVFGGSGQVVSVNASNQFTAASGLTAFAVGDLVVLRNGNASAGNSNRVLRVTAATGTLLTVAQTLVAETLPATATLQRVGVRTAAGDIDVNAAGAYPVLTSTTLDFTTLGLTPGAYIWIGGDDALTFFPTNAVNNCLARVRTITANALTLDKASKGAMITEAQASSTIEIYLPQVLKNEQIANFVRRTYQIERQLGVPDIAFPSQIQSEYFTGCIFNEASLTFNQADKVSLEGKFKAADQELRSGSTGLKAGTRPNIENANAYNTASDMKRVRLAKVISGDEAPTPLFAYVPNLTLNITNNVEALKALTVLGAFEMSTGDFVVTGSLSGFFSDIAAISAIRGNATLTLDIMEFLNNQGWVMDMPLVTLGDGSVMLEKDKAALVPLTLECASGEEVDPALDYTLAVSWFDGLPNRAATPNG